MEKIVVVGAGPYQDPLIRKAKSMGLETHVFAWQTGDPGEYSADYFYPINITNQNFICDECRRIKPAAIVSAASDLAMGTVAYIAGELGLISNSQRAIRNTIDKLEMRRTLADAGIPQPDFVEIGDRIPMEALETLCYPMVVKPCDRSGGRGVTRVDDAEALRYSVAEARDISFVHKAIVEEYVAGKNYSVETISYQGSHHILAITETEMSENQGAFFTLAHRQPANIRGELTAALKNITCASLDALGITVGAAHTEFVVDDAGGVFVIEVSGSMGGDFIGSDLTPLSTGMDYLRMIVDTACGKAPDLGANGARQDVEIRFLTCRSDLERWNETCALRASTVVRSRRSGDQERLPDQPGKRHFGYYITAHRPREMGGYLPLELSQSQEYHNVPAGRMRRLNSGRTAMWYAVRSCEPERVFLPHFCTPSMARSAREAGAQVCYYRVDEALTPVELTPGPRDAVVLVNFCGLLDHQIHSYAGAHPEVQLIVDNAGAFFCPPIWRDHAYNIYSCRKFIGVPDGAYLLGYPLSELELAQDQSAPRSGFLLESLESGTSSGYQMSLDNEQYLAAKRANMSNLTLCLLKSTNYGRIRQKRRENYAFLQELLGERNGLGLPLGDCVPQYYPFLGQEGLREYLLQHRIYMPVLWRKCFDASMDGWVEQRYSRQICCLPIDQRYGKEDMKYLAGLILEYLH